MYKISILYKYDHFSDHLWDNYRIDCGALGLQIWMHIAIQCNIYIGMSKNLTYTLSVGAAADTVCGKGLLQGAWKPRSTCKVCHSRRHTAWTVAVQPDQQPLNDRRAAKAP